MSANKPTRSQLKHQAILDAAKQAFNQFGVQSTSMDTIAQIAQVSKRTVYNHFESKETLVMTLVRQLWQVALVDIHIEFDPHQPLSSQLEAIISSEIKVIGCQEYINLSRAAFGHLLYHPELMAQEINAFNEQQTCLFRWLQAANQAQKLNLPDVQLAHDQIHHLIKGSCFWPQLMQSKAPLSLQAQQQLSEQTVAMFLSHYQNKHTN